MARTARTVVPQLPHHIVQRGNRKQNVFFSDSDRYEYLSLIRKSALEEDVIFISWCLMDNHVHLVAVPGKGDSFARCFRKAHSLYSRNVNRQNEWSGHLWQYRFSSSPLGPSYLHNAVRYVEQNPVRAGIVGEAWEYRWSSAAYHTGRKRSDPLISVDSDQYLSIDDWEGFLTIEPDAEVLLRIRKAAARNRPAARQWFISAMKSRNPDLSGSRTHHS
ncbi:MAG: hypothetical protein AVO35_06965 [Candidatus Aegiribacteria sp. MLS_C]|nr:MAG: hypothetical protein AVO35_06965 [Candidatus Aegiribacteria sp. MLS_C]